MTTSSAALSASPLRKANHDPIPDLPLHAHPNGVGVVEGGGLIKPLSKAKLNRLRLTLSTVSQMDPKPKTPDLTPNAQPRNAMTQPVTTIETLTSQLNELRAENVTLGAQVHQMRDTLEWLHAKVRVYGTQTMEVILKGLEQGISTVPNSLPHGNLKHGLQQIEPKLREAEKVINLPVSYFEDHVKALEDVAEATRRVGIRRANLFFIEEPAHVEHFFEPIDQALDRLDALKKGIETLGAKP